MVETPTSAVFRRASSMRCETQPDETTRLALASSHVNDIRRITVSSGRSIRAPRHQPEASRDAQVEDRVAPAVLEQALVGRDLRDALAARRQRAGLVVELVDLGRELREALPFRPGDLAGVAR